MSVIGEENKEDGKRSRILIFNSSRWHLNLGKDWWRRKKAILCTEFIPKIMNLTGLVICDDAFILFEVGKIKGYQHQLGFDWFLTSGRPS